MMRLARQDLAEVRRRTRLVLAALVAASAWLLLVSPDAFGFGFVSRFGTQGAGDGEFRGPEGIAIDRQGFVYIVDRGNHRVQKFTRDGVFVAKWGSEGSGDGQFLEPNGIAVDNRGHVYVTDIPAQRVTKFTDDGAFVRKWQSTGVREGDLFDARGIAVDSAGFVYVAMNGNQPRIQKFTPDGAFVAMWGPEGTVEPSFGGITGVAVDSQDNLYVTGADRPDTDLVYKSTSTGAPITRWGGPQGTGDGEFFQTSGVAIGPDGSVYVVQYGQPRVQHFTSSGVFLDRFGEGVVRDWEQGRFYYPEWLAVASDGHVYVTDRIGDRVSIFGPEGTTTPIPDPVVGESVNLARVRGVVTTKCGRARRFTRLTDAAQVPVGCQVDARRGQVRLTSAAGPAPQPGSGRLQAAGAAPVPVQTAAFDGGIFQVLQKRTANPVTELKLTEALTCQTSRSSARSSRARSRRLWGRGAGRFRTRGRHSTATVRGTTWLTKDTCNTTTTVVREGTVVVRDLAKRRNVTVGAGGRYTARARARR
jgi:sugar lactone lactonase YvrE